MRPTLRGAITVLLLGVAACDCDHVQTRGATVSVRLSAPGAEVEQYFGLSVEEFGGLDSRFVRFGVSGADLRWHVRGVRLLEAAGEGRVLFDIPAGMPGPDADDAGGGQASDADLRVGTWEQFLVLLETHGVAVELTTDVDGMERLLFPINAPDATEWISHPCPSD